MKFEYKNLSKKMLCLVVPMVMVFAGCRKENKQNDATDVVTDFYALRLYATDVVKECNLDLAKYKEFKHKRDSVVRVAYQKRLIRRDVAAQAVQYNDSMEFYGRRLLERDGDIQDIDQKLRQLDRALSDKRMKTR